VRAWHVYIVRCSDSTLYTGIAIDVAARVAAHNRGRGAKYTRSRTPVELVYCEAAESRSAALRREHAIKRLAPAAKHALAAQRRVPAPPG
jgi:predicted GIY-YIG superfamily endonuclease